MMLMKIAFISAGNMGSAMARNLLRAAHGVTVHNRTRAHAEPLQKDGAALADSPADAVRGVDAVITMLADDAAVEQAVLNFSETLAPGALHIGMSTISVACSQWLAKEHSSRGQHYVAAPVFGRPEAPPPRNYGSLPPARPSRSSAASPYSPPSGAVTPWWA